MAKFEQIGKAAWEPSLITGNYSDVIVVPLEKVFVC
jgi:hypothetical protein